MTVRTAVETTRRALPELAVACAILVGWAFLTDGLAHLAPHVVAARAVWPLSVGLLLLSAAGWGFLLEIARHGLYVLRSGPGTVARPRVMRAAARQKAAS